MKKMDFCLLISNIIFYIGIFIVDYLYIIDNNTFMWLIAEGLTIVGIIGICTIPDMMINNGIENISIRLVRYTIIIKYILFIILYSLLDNFFVQVNIVMILGLVIDVVLEYFLLKQIRNTNVDIYDFIRFVKQIDTACTDSVMKIFFFYAVGFIFYFNMNGSAVERIAGFVGCFILHVYVSESIIKKIRQVLKVKLYKIRLLIWALFLMTVLCVNLKYEMIVYSLIGTYWMIIVDLLQDKKTSLINRKFFQ